MAGLSVLLTIQNASITLHQHTARRNIQRRQLTQHTGDPAEDTQTDVDQEVGAAAALDEDGDGRHEERQEVEEDVRLW